MNVAQFFDQVSDWMVDYHTPGGVDKDGWQVIGRFFCIFVKVPKIGQELLLSSLYIYSSKPLTLHLQFYILVLCITYLHCGKNIISSFYFNKTCQPPCGQYKSVDFISKRNLPCSLYISVDFIKKKTFLNIVRNRFSGNVSRQDVLHRLRSSKTLGPKVQADHFWSLETTLLYKTCRHHDAG